MTDLESALQQARGRGDQWIAAFKASSYDDQIEHLAEHLYYAIEHDPYGYPNGRARWDEIPEIDLNCRVDTDKLRYRRAAKSALKLSKYMKDGDET